MDERRKQPRIEVSTTAVVLARHNDGVTMTIESLSVSGARMVGPLTVAVDEPLQILFELDGRPIDVRAEVVRVEPRDTATDRVSVRFVEVQPAAHDAIYEIVRQRLQIK